MIRYARYNKRIPHLHDIAMIKLDEYIDFKCNLVERAMIYKEPLASGVQCEVVGWGRFRHNVSWWHEPGEGVEMRKATVVTKSIFNCNISKNLEVRGLYTINHMCIAGATCYGDNGGPLLWRSKWRK